jgi:hypothetical protein
MRFFAAVGFTAALLFAQSANIASHHDAGPAQFPTPSGSFATARVTYYWTDPARPEPLSTKAGARREIVVYVWYPAVKTARAANPAPYFPDFSAARAAISDADFKDVPPRER